MTHHRSAHPRLLLISVCLFALASCAINSEITRSFVNPKAETSGLKGVMIVGVAADQDVRAAFEEAFAKALRARGVPAQTSYGSVKTVDVDSEVDAAMIQAAARAANLDTILITRYLGQTAEEVYHPGTYYYGNMPAYGGVYGPWGGYYHHANQMAYQQPAWTTNRTYTLISDLFATDSGEHIWQAVSDTLKSGSERKLLDDVISSFVKDLGQKGLLD